MKKIKSRNEEETKEIAKKIAELTQAGMTIILEGDLGAGKTTFTKGIGSALGVERIIKSPTYTIVREYQGGRLPLYHIDLYRLEAAEVADLALDEYFDGAGLSVVEWPSVSPEDLPEKYLEVSLIRDLDDLNKRTIELKAKGKIYEELVNHLKLD